jgi:hypothetical protein
MYDDARELAMEHDVVEEPQYYEASQDELTPQATHLEEDASPRRARGTVAAKAFHESSAVRTATRQPEYLTRYASAQKSHTRKPVARSDIFDSDSESSQSTQPPLELSATQRSIDAMTSRMSAGAQEELMRRLLHENESLKEQLHAQLVRNDEMRSATKQLAASPVGRSFRTSVVVA